MYTALRHNIAHSSIDVPTHSENSYNKDETRASMQGFITTEFNLALFRLRVCRMVQRVFIRIKGRQTDLPFIFAVGVYVIVCLFGGTKNIGHAVYEPSIYIQLVL